MLNNCSYVIYLLFLVPFIESAHRLNEYITHYETLSYNQTEIHAAHQRFRRSASSCSNAGVHLHFRAHGRDFRLRLCRDVSVFSDNLEVLDSNGPLQVDLSHIYHGHLVGEPDSAVFGSLIDGVFEGKIVSSTGSFYVEKARNYFLQHQQNQNFHSVIYNENHVENPYQHKRKGHAGGCGITDVQKSQIAEDRRTEDRLKSSVTTFNYDKYSKEDNENELPHYHKEVNYTCSLYIHTDPFLWRHIREGIPEHKDPTKESEVNQKTREEILSLIGDHIIAVNHIYSDTKFSGRLEHRYIKFEVKKVKIDDDSSCKCNNPSSCEKNQFCMEHTDSGKLLDIHSLDNYDDFCLAYLFTYRNFTAGNLGLAFLASPSGDYGGICENYKMSSDSFESSLNTGIITFLGRKNKKVSPKISQLILAHEFGHSFGASHDPVECQPGGLDGNYIMFEYTSSDRPNNNKFSPCSIRNISSVLDAMDENKKRKCFSIPCNQSEGPCYNSATYKFVPKWQKIYYYFIYLILPSFNIGIFYFKK